MPTILVADDDRHGREIYAMILRLSGYEVLTAPDGEEALRVLRSRPVDLVLLDLAMPEASGPTVLNAMGHDPALSGVPVVVMTALPEQTARDRVRGMNVSALLIKSRFSKRDLVGRIDHLLGRPAAVA